MHSEKAVIEVSGAPIAGFVVTGTYCGAKMDIRVQRRLSHCPPECEFLIFKKLNTD